MDDIVRSILARLQAVRLSGAWAQISCDAFVAADLPSWEEFAVEGSSVDRVSLRAFFAAHNGRPIVPIVNRGGPSIVDLVGDGGCLSGGAGVGYQLIDDEHSRRAFETASKVFLTGNLSDAICLRGLGLSAAPVSGFGPMDAAGVERFAEKFGIAREHSASRPDSAARQQAADAPTVNVFESASDANETDLTPTEPFKACLVRWSVSTLSEREPAELTQFVEVLQRLKRLRGLVLYDLDTWEPTADAIDDLRFALTHGEVLWARDAAIESVQDGGTFLGPAIRERPVNFLEAYSEAYLNLLGAGENSPRRDTKQAARVFIRLVLEHVSGPLVADLDLCMTAAERILRFQLAQLIGQLTEVSARAAINCQPGTSPALMRDVIGLNREILPLLKMLQDPRTRMQR